MHEIKTLLQLMKIFQYYKAMQSLIGVSLDNVFFFTFRTLFNSHSGVLQTKPSAFVVLNYKVNVRSFSCRYTS